MKTRNIKPSVRCNDYFIGQGIHTICVRFGDCYPSFIRHRSLATGLGGNYQTIASNKGYTNDDLQRYHRVKPVGGRWHDISEASFSLISFLGFYHQLTRFTSRKVRGSFERALASPSSTAMFYEASFTGRTNSLNRGRFTVNHVGKHASSQKLGSGIVDFAVGFASNINGSINFKWFIVTEWYDTVRGQFSYYLISEISESLIETANSVMRNRPNSPVTKQNTDV